MERTLPTIAGLFLTTPAGSIAINRFDVFIHCRFCAPTTAKHQRRRLNMPLMSYHAARPKIHTASQQHALCATQRQVRRLSLLPPSLPPCRTSRNGAPPPRIQCTVVLNQATCCAVRSTAANSATQTVRKLRFTHMHTAPTSRNSRHSHANLHNHTRYGATADNGHRQ